MVIYPKVATFAPSNESEHETDRQTPSWTYNGFPAGGAKKDVVRFVSDGSKFRWLLTDVAEGAFRFTGLYEAIRSMDGEVMLGRNDIIGFIIKSWREMGHLFPD